jgi:tRNA dimethylallyltransferase
MNSESPLIVIVGPTGSGKTKLSLEVAREFDGEIISCDSVAVYREFEIGTAKPSREERASVPHHLIDVADPDKEFTAGEYARLARQALHDVTSRGKLPIVVGGTGLYLRALLDGLFAGPQRSDELRDRLRKKTEERGAGYLHRILRRLDRGATELIHPNDTAKVIRAIEVSMTAKQPITEAWKQGRDPLKGYRILRIGLNPERQRLYERINHRAMSMFERGLIDETRSLLDKYVDERRAPALKSLGYRQAGQAIRGELEMPAAVQSAQQGHRNYAKRQLTWFRREAGIEWIDDFGDSRTALERARNMVLLFLQG